MELDYYTIEMHEPSEDFAKCWQAAGRHLSNLGDGRINWLKADLTPPFLEHLSFRVGNQLFFVHLQDAEGNLQTIGNLNGLSMIARECKGIACLMPMRRTPNGWKVEVGGWGLIELESGNPLNPIELISNDKIEMTNWEILDFAVQVVREHIQNELEFDIVFSQSNPAVQPSIWFNGKYGLEWVVVRANTLTLDKLIGECDISAVAKQCADKSNLGNTATVSFANEKQCLSESSDILPLIRGHGAQIFFNGLNLYR